MSTPEDFESVPAARRTSQQSPVYAGTDGAAQGVPFERAMSREWGLRHPDRPWIGDEIDLDRVVVVGRIDHLAHRGPNATSTQNDPDE